jgi:hypothetical protein
MSRLATIFLSATALVASPQSHAAGGQSAPLIGISATHGWAVKKGSPDFDRIRAFLLSQVGAADSYSASDLDWKRLGDFMVRVSIHRINGVESRNETEALLIPSGGDCSAGDTWSVSTRTPEVDQAWTWTYSGGPDGGAWKLTRYTYRLVRLPNEPAAG